MREAALPACPGTRARALNALPSESALTTAAPLPAPPCAGHPSAPERNLTVPRGLSPREYLTCEVHVVSFYSVKVRFLFPFVSLHVSQHMSASRRASCSLIDERSSWRLP